MKQRNARLAWLFALAAVLVVLFFVPWFTLVGLDKPPNACLQTNRVWPPDMPPTPVLGWQFATVSVCFICLAIGSLASYAGRSSKVEVLFLGGTQDIRRARVLVEVGLIVLLAFSTGALVYESFALLTNVWPVTWYVHCGNDAHPYLAAAGAGALSLLLGNWLWHDAPHKGTPS